MEYDEKTRKWFSRHWNAETTVARCEQCGLYYKPMLGHKCRKGENDGSKTD